MTYWLKTKTKALFRTTYRKYNLLNQLLPVHQLRSRSDLPHKAAFPRAKFLCHISHALQSLLTDFCGIITVILYSRTDTDAKWINNNYNFGINDCRACNLWQRKFGRVLEPLGCFANRFRILVLV